MFLNWCPLEFPLTFCSQSLSFASFSCCFSTCEAFFGRGAGTQKKRTNCSWQFFFLMSGQQRSPAACLGVRVNSRCCCTCVIREAARCRAPGGGGRNRQARGGGESNRLDGGKNGNKQEGEQGVMKQRETQTSMFSLFFRCGQQQNEHLKHADINTGFNSVQNSSQLTLIAEKQAEFRRKLLTIRLSG